MDGQIVLPQPDASKAKMLKTKYLLTLFVAYNRCEWSESAVVWSSVETRA